MEILGGGRPDDQLPGPARRGLGPGEPVEMLDAGPGAPADGEGPGDAGDDHGDDLPGEGGRVGAEPLAVASLLLALAALLGVGSFYVSALLDLGYTDPTSLQRAVRLTSGAWAPGLVSIGLGLLARRATTARTAAWVRHVWLGSSIAVGCLLAITFGLVAWSQMQDAPSEF